MTAFACSAPAESKQASPSAGQTPPAASAASPTGSDVRPVPAPRPAPDAREAGTVVRVYSIADLVAAPTRSAPTETSSGSMFGAPPPDVMPLEAQLQAQRVAKFAGMLQSLIAVDSWTDNGGLEGAIQVLDDSLLIRQTPANHKQIEELLASLRKSAVPIQIRLTWLSAQPTAMIEASEIRDAVRVLKMTDEAAALFTAKDAVLDRIELSAYSGDPLLATSGTRIPYVSDLEPVVGTGAVGFDPTISSIDTGTSLRGAAYVLPGGEVRLDLVTGHVTLTEMATASAGVAGAVIQTPHVADRTMAIRMTAPLGKPVVVGAVSASTGTTQPSDGKMIYLVITVEAVPAK